MVNYISTAITLVGLQPLAATCGVTYQALRKWEKNGRLPRTEYSGETQYAALIAAVCREKDPRTRITREALLELEPVTHHSSPVTGPKERVA